MDDVKFVAIERAMLVRPQISSVGMDSQALRVAMPERPDLRFGVFFPDKGIIGRDGAVVAQAKNFAGMIREFLRPVLMVAITNGYERYPSMNARRPRNESDLRSTRRRLKSVGDRSICCRASESDPQPWYCARAGRRNN